MTPTELIKSRLGVVSLVESYLKLEKAGMNYKARCPFHAERTASFYVSPARDIWHCFGCGKGGDIFKFVMEMDGLEFSEALEMLAQRVGVEIRPEPVEVRSLRVKLLGLLEDAAFFFEENLKKEKPALAYLRKRGLEPSLVKDFRLGFAPEGWHLTYEYLKQKGYADDDIDRAGLLVEGERGRYDRFRSRIIFPLEDYGGRVIGFGGRAYGNEGPAKYINSPQTILYDKSRYLYGFGKSKNEIRQQKSVVVVEGYLDCILSHQAGVKNTVSVSGTALTDIHLGLLRRLAETLVLAFDFDDAGLEASRRAVSLAYGHDFVVKLVGIEGGKDPADVVLKNPAHWVSMVKEAFHSVDFFLKRLVGNTVPRDPASKRKISEGVLPLIAGIRNEIERAHWVRELTKILQVAEEAVWKELEGYKYQQSSREFSHKGSAVKLTDGRPLLTRKARLEEQMVGLIFLEPRLILLGELPNKADCSLLATGELFELLQKNAAHGINERFIETLAEDLKLEAGRYLLEAELFFGKRDGLEDEFLHILHSWKELSLKEKLAQLNEEIKRLEQAGHKDEMRVHVEMFRELTQRLADLVLLHPYNKNEKKGKKEIL